MTSKSIIKKYGQKAYDLLKDFLSTEMISSKVNNFIKDLIRLENVRKCLYEGNMYCVEKRMDNSLISIYDLVAIEQGVLREQVEVKIERNDLLEMINDYNA